MKNLTIILILTGLLCSFGIFRQTLGNNLLSFDDEFTIEQFLQLNYQNFIMENTNGKSLDFQQEQIKKYLIAREYLKELLYHCKNAKSSLPLHQACQSYRTRLENDTYDYSSIFASTGSLQ